MFCGHGSGPDRGKSAGGGIKDLVAGMEVWMRRKDREITDFDEMMEREEIDKAQRKKIEKELINLKTKLKPIQIP